MKSWEDCLSFAEFPYNRAIHSTISYLPFEIVYDFNLQTLLDSIPLLVHRRGGLDRKKKIELVMSIHEKVQLQFEKNEHGDSS